MKPILTNTANLVLKGPEGSDVMDLPVTLITYGDGQKGVESCWKLDAEELKEVKRTGNIYFICMAPTHPPICLSPYSSLTGKADGQYDTGVNPLTDKPGLACIVCIDANCLGWQEAALCGKPPGPDCELCQEDACPCRHR